MRFFLTLGNRSANLVSPQLREVSLVRKAFFFAFFYKEFQAEDRLLTVFLRAQCVASHYFHLFFSFCSCIIFTPISIRCWLSYVIWLACFVYSLILDNERWKQADVPTELQTLVDSLVDGKKSSEIFSTLHAFVFTFSNLFTRYFPLMFNRCLPKGQGAEIFHRCVWLKAVISQYWVTKRECVVKPKQK